MKSRNKWMEGTEAGTVVPGPRYSNGFRLGRMDGIHLHLDLEDIWVYTYVEILPAVPLRLVHFTVCILQLCTFHLEKSEGCHTSALSQYFPQAPKSDQKVLVKNSLYFCYNQISFSNKLCPITFKNEGEDEREGGPIVGGEKEMERRRE